MERARVLAAVALCALLAGCGNGVPDSFFQVISTSPDETAVDVALESEVTVTFTEGIEVYEASVTEDTFLLSNGQDKVVGTYTAADNTVTFAPLAPFDRNTTYFGVLTTGIRDAEGAALEAQYTFSFHTNTALGELDPGFSGDGITVGALSTENDGIGDLLVLSNDTIVAAGFSSDTAAVARYLGDGTLDETFGSAGVATLAGPSGAIFRAMARTADGSIIAAGEAGYELLVARFTAEGELDLSFGGGDGYYQGSTGEDDAAFGVAVADDATIYAVGARTGMVNHGVIYAIKPDGTGLEPAFNSGNVFAYDAGYEGSQLRAVILDAEGNLIAAGTSHWQADGLDQSVAAVVRITPAGALDTSFAGSGISLTVLNDAAIAYGCALAADGGIYAVGATTTGTVEVPFIMRLATDGTLDESFGTAGITQVGLENASLYDVALQANGKPVAAGYADSTTRGYDGLIIRFTTAGALDISFGPSDQGVAAVSTSPDDELFFGVGLATGGRIVAGGRITTAGSADSDFYLVGLR